MVTRNRIVVVVASDPRDEAALVALVSGDERWACASTSVAEVVRAPAEIAKASVVLTWCTRADSELVAGAVPEATPIIGCGDVAPPRSVSWLRKPTAAVLRPLLHDLLGAPSKTTASAPPSASPISSIPPSSSTGAQWRRKSDMIIGRSVAIQRLLATLDRLASSKAPVTVTGESGTGKELVARALHYSSPRAAAPFIAINCAAIPEALFEAELFGYMRGAFTGAVTARVGAFEAANNGTLFLDELGELPLTLQPKLLRVLERSEITRLGSNDSRKVAVRVVAATNRHLEAEVRAGRFRQDLFYRLRVCNVHIAPLRERPEDIAPLVAHHLSILAARERRQTVPHLTPKALERMLAHSWPGNVRELINVLESALLLCPTNTLDVDHLQLQSSSLVPPASAATILPYREAKSQFESEYYARLLRVAGGNISLASKMAQKTRKEIYDGLRRAGLDAESYRDPELTTDRDN